MPVEMRYASAFAATLRGSRLYCSSVNGSRIEKFMTRVLAERNGSMKAVEGSGISFMSDSWMAWKPRMDEPSNIRPSSKTDWSNDSTGMLKCCMTPGRSMNRTSTNRTFSSLMYFRTSCEFLNIIPPAPFRVLSLALVGLASLPEYHRGRAPGTL
ncbi:unannotated protein [freshwater metagenome]|uniref:Unannotated protein n=1 Tax=freshwater metagenome TaxID=449393 RepID=A0A6J7D5L0_9ZZZZ